MSSILHLFCGKIAAGKSTLAKHLAAEPGTVLISEDAWLSGLFGPDMESVGDYVEYSGRLRAVMGPHVALLLKSGLSVVLDFQANTRTARRWMREVADEGGATAVLHYLELPEEICKERLRVRNQAGAHAFAPDEEQFDLISRYFEVPEEEEGLPILVHGGP